MLLTDLYNQLFDLCVDILKYWAKLTGMTYKEINIWIFCILEPIIFLVLVGILVGQQKVINELKKNK